MDSLSSYSSSTSKRLKKISSGVKDNNIPIPSSTIDLLPNEIQILILNKLDVVVFHRFGAVCRQWQSITFAANQIQIRRHQFLLKPQFPWLMFSFSESGYHHGFLNLFHDKVFRLELPKIRGARCCGSSWGWLLGNHDGCVFLFNPFTRIRIDLPPKSTLPCLGVDFGPRRFEPSPNYIRKVMLLSPPSAASTAAANDSTLDGNPSSVATDDCLVVALYCSRHLAFCRPGDRAWTALTKRFIGGIGYEDFIVYQGKLYVIKLSYDLILLELSPQPRETSCDIAPPPPLTELLDEDELSSLYLVECRGELLVVAKWTAFTKDDDDLTGPCDWHGDRPITTMFEVFKLDLQHRCWIKVEDLGDQMLFIGTSTGISISALDYHGFKGNSIYFTDDYYHNYPAMWPPPKRERAACYDLGVFHLQDNSILRSFSNASHSWFSPPVWFTPVLW